jgi:tagatose-1,6-bisphosphate aldolase non-catalytic subunit AgaZ/GatZ
VNDIVEIARRNEVTRTEQSPYGVRYVIGGEVTTPTGAIRLIRTVWFIDNEEQIPHFVTAYPR